MNTPRVLFSEAEKLVFVQMIDLVIQADDIIHMAELDIMSQLMKRLNFDEKYILDARNIDIDDGYEILASMTPEKKSALIRMLKVVANIDGHLHEKEEDLILTICYRIGLCREVG